MAAIYDELGNYVGDDGAGAGNTPADIAKMRVAVGSKLDARSPLTAQRQQPSAAVRQVAAIDEKPLTLDDIYLRLTTPLSKPVSRFEALQRDIASLPQQVSDVTNTLFGNPFQMAVRTPIEALLTGKTSTPQVNALLEKNVAPIQTPQGEAFASGVGNLFEAAKIPQAWPTMPGGMPRRPMLTGSDVLAMKGDVARLATQMGEIGPDFQAAQTGFRRMDPITGKPTVGARLQSLADEWAGLMERRQSLQDEVSPFAELASPEMYAVRKKGTRLIEPTRTETGKAAAFDVDPATNIVRSAVGMSRDLTPYTGLAQWGDIIESEMPGDLRIAMRDYVQNRKAEMFPGLSVSDARRAFDKAYADKEANAAKTAELYTEFLNTPEAQAMAQQADTPIVTPAEFVERHAQAVDWLQGPFSNYIVRNVGAEGDPLVALAAQGLTYQPASKIIRAASDIEPSWLRGPREKAGLPAEGTIAPALAAKESELATAQNELRVMEERRAALSEQAQAQNMDPARIPEYARLTEPVRNKGRQVQQLEKQVENLKTGVAYEAVSDIGVVPRTPAEFLERDLDPYERPFYPSATSAAPDETIYASRKDVLTGELGLGKIAADFYNDVVTGKIPVDKLKNLTVEKFVRSGAEKRIAKEIEEAKLAQKAKQSILDAAKSQLEFAKIDLPNAKVIEIDATMEPETIAKLMSLDTEVLDHCVGQCGQAAGGTRNILTNEHQRYKPIFSFVRDAFIGSKDPSSYSYVRAVLNRDKTIASFRNPETGLPVATVDLSRSEEDLVGALDIGYVSGYQNGAIEPQYANAIAEYLNKYANDIINVSSNLKENAGIYDTDTTPGFKHLANTAARQVGVPVDVIRSIDPATIPRFMTQEQFNEFVLQNRDNMVPTTEPIVAPESTPAAPLPMPDPIPTEIADDPQALRQYGDRHLTALTEIEGRITNLEDMQQRGLPVDARVLQDFRDIHQNFFRTIRAVNDRIRELRAAQEQPMQLPAPPEELQLPQLRGQVDPLANLYDDLQGGFETDWTDINNRGATLPEDAPMPTQIMRMSNNALTEFLTPADLGNAGEMVAHIQDQFAIVEADAHDLGNDPDVALQDFISTIRENPTGFFGEISPYLIEYTIRAAEGRIQGYAKGGRVEKKVHIAKSLPAMRAELLRRA